MFYKDLKHDLSYALILNKYLPYSIVSGLIPLEVVLLLHYLVLLYQYVNLFHHNKNKPLIIFLLSLRILTIMLQGWMFPVSIGAVTSFTAHLKCWKLNIRQKRTGWNPLPPPLSSIVRIRIILTWMFRRPSTGLCTTIQQTPTPWI